MTKYLVLPLCYTSYDGIDTPEYCLLELHDDLLAWVQEISMVTRELGKKYGRFREISWDAPACFWVSDYESLEPHAFRMIETDEVPRQMITTELDVIKVIRSDYPLMYLSCSVKHTGDVLESEEFDLQFLKDIMQETEPAKIKLEEE